MKYTEPVEFPGMEELINNLDFYKDKLLNEHKSKYGDLGEAAPSGGDAQFGTLPLAGVKQNIECIQRILDDSLARKYGQPRCSLAPARS